MAAAIAAFVIIVTAFAFLSTDWARSPPTMNPWFVLEGVAIGGAILVVALVLRWSAGRKVPPAEMFPV